MSLLKDKKRLIALNLVSLALIGEVNAGSMGETTIPTTSYPYYIGVFGGAGGVNNTGLSQIGTAFYTAGQGGPLAVNAHGSANADVVWAGGGFIGYKLNPRNTGTWVIDPSVEFEGYYLGLTQTGHDIDNNTVRLSEHDFSVTYPMDNGILLANGVLRFNNSGWSSVSPYVGGGVGAAVVSISGADSTQTSPYEAGVNHYNSNTNATDWAFAAQVKAGLNYAVSPQVALFAEYRFLYVSSTDYTFGSTQYPAHVPTTNWTVNMDSMYFNMGTLGIRYDV